MVKEKNEQNAKQRLDKFLAVKGFTSSRERAQELIQKQKVKVNHKVATKGSLSVGPNDRIELEENEFPWVSRGALKLEKALDNWEVKVKGKKCLDVGACSGGFTEVLLNRGAERVYALDVGRGQLSSRLDQNERVINLEGINARSLSPGIIPETPEMASIDVSYISLTLVLPSVINTLKEKGEIIALVKPQFEVGRKNVKKGIVSRQEDRLWAREKVEECGEEYGCKSLGVIESPVWGGKGNKEFLIYFQKNF